jgi:hypothetical protein
VLSTRKIVRGIKERERSMKERGSRRVSSMDAIVEG